MRARITLNGDLNYMKMEARSERPGIWFQSLEAYCDGFIGVYGRCCCHLGHVHAPCGVKEAHEHNGLLDPRSSVHVKLLLTPDIKICSGFTSDGSTTNVTKCIHPNVHQRLTSLRTNSGLGCLLYTWRPNHHNKTNNI